MIYVAFYEDNYIFVDNLILYPGHNNLILEIITIKFRGSRVDMSGQGPRAEKKEYLNTY